MYPYIKFGKNRRLHVPKILVFKFDLYASYQILYIDIGNFQKLYLLFDYKSKIPVSLFEVPKLVNRYC